MASSSSSPRPDPADDSHSDHQDDDDDLHHHHQLHHLHHQSIHTPQQSTGPKSTASSTTTGPSAPKNKQCPFCMQLFTSSSLGRHLDLFIRAVNPKAEDGKHDVDAIRRMRGRITRRQPRVRDRQSPAGTATSSAITPITLPASNPGSAPPSAPPSGPPRMDSPGPSRTGGHAQLHFRAHPHHPISRPDFSSQPASMASTPHHHPHHSLSQPPAQAQYHHHHSLPPPAPASASASGPGPASASALSAHHPYPAHPAQPAHPAHPPYPSYPPAPPPAVVDRGRAAELALRELCQTIAHSRTPTSHPFPFDPFSLTFPALVLQVLPPPATLFATAVLAGPDTWPLEPPGHSHRQAVLDTIEDRIHAHRSSLSPSSSSRLGPDPTDAIADHVTRAYDHFAAASDQDRSRMWTIELMRALAASQTASASLTVPSLAGAAVSAVSTSDSSSVPASAPSPTPIPTRSSVATSLASLVGLSMTGAAGFVGIAAAEALIGRWTGADLSSVSSASTATHPPLSSASTAATAPSTLNTAGLSGSVHGQMMTPTPVQFQPPILSSGLGVRLSPMTPSSVDDGRRKSRKRTKDDQGAGPSTSTATTATTPMSTDTGAAGPSASSTAGTTGTTTHTAKRARLSSGPVDEG